MSSETLPPNLISPCGILPETVRILIVDDEPAILFAYKKLIENDQRKVDICSSMDTALQKICDQRYLAVITDMRLSGTDNGDGLEILRFIQKEQPTIKTIITTGSDDSEIVNQAQTMGVSYCFKKPVQPDELLAVLNMFSRESSGL